MQPAVIAPENKLEGAVSGSRGDRDDVPFQRSVRICTAPGRELTTCHELVCTAGRLCAQQRHPRAVRSLQMVSALLALQPEQPKAQIFRLVLNPIPKIHSLILLQHAPSLKVNLAWSSYLCSEPQQSLNLQLSQHIIKI